VADDEDGEDGTSKRTALLRFGSEADLTLGDLLWVWAFGWVIATPLPLLGDLCSSASGASFAGGAMGEMGGVGRSGLVVAERSVSMSGASGGLLVLVVVVVVVIVGLVW
jgi:hypothetical protein